MIQRGSVSERVSQAAMLNALRIMKEGKALSNHTCVVFDELLQRVELGPRGDVVAAAVQLSDFVVLDVVALGLVPVSYGEGEGTCTTEAAEVSVGPQSSEAGRKSFSRLFRVTVTFGGFALPHQERPSVVTRDEQQPLSVFATHLAKIPPVERRRRRRKGASGGGDHSVACVRGLLWFSLFSLDGVSRRHVVAGDVTFPARVDGASLPPVSFSARAQRQLS